MRSHSLAVLATTFVSVSLWADTGGDVYRNLKKFQLSGATIVAENLVLARDRVEMTFDGVFYLEEPVGGEPRGAVFVGRGTFRAEAPPVAFERENVQRLLGADLVESDFRTAVLRFTDGALGVQAAKATNGTVPPEALALAAQFEARFLKETGANVAARLAISILNHESPGFFLAQFDGGKRGRFTYMLDHQARIAVPQFGINAGEAGMIFSYRGALGGNDVWMSFHDAEVYKTGRATYSDVHDLVRVSRYTIDADVRDPKRALKLTTRLDCELLAPGVSAVPFAISESLPEFDNARQKKAMRLKGARLADGAPVEAVQEEWEGGFTVFLPAARAAGKELSLIVELEGDFMAESPYSQDVFYPLGTYTWYPRHGYLKRSTYDLTFRHRKQHVVASVGVRGREEAVPGAPNEAITRWKMDTPVPIATFGVGRMERHAEPVKIGARELPIEFYSLPGATLPIKEDFILAELGNCVKYFSALFGDYPYPNFGAMYFPRSYGQGFATMLMIPPADSAGKRTFSFLAHETAHQWWGNAVSWRSYRDQWLSEGFAEYSGALYAGFREKGNTLRELVAEMRKSLLEPPRTERGIGNGRLCDIGPITLGRRLSTRETQGAYESLVYSKGALVLRMLHFLFSDTATGNDTEFFAMMSDFVTRYQGQPVATDDFVRVANEYFARTPIAQRYKIGDLNWFFQQWVNMAVLPSYRLEYRLEDQPDGSVVIRGTIWQDNVPDRFATVLPVVARLGRDQRAYLPAFAFGPQSTFAAKLPRKPESIEIDPDLWILSEKTTTRQLR